jgi:uncharacterized membrane protein YjdF
MTRNLDNTTGEHATWVVLLIAVSTISSSLFACVTPFPALAVAAAYVLPTRAAALTATGVWLANQAVGFGSLHYPWDQNTILWGLAIGTAAVVATGLASRILRQMRHGIVIATGIALLVAFAAYEVALFLVALVLGGEDAFAPSIIGQFALLNIGWTVGLVMLAEGVHYVGILGSTTGHNRRRAV